MPLLVSYTEGLGVQMGLLKPGGCSLSIYEPSSIRTISCLADLHGRLQKR